MRSLPPRLDQLRKETQEVVRNAGLGPREGNSARRGPHTSSTEAMGRVLLSKMREVRTEQSRALGNTGQKWGEGKKPGASDER